MNQIYSIGGGKGGTGKSFIAASLGINLAKQGKKVVLVDLDLGASNLHALVGLKNPQMGLDLFINKRMKRLEEGALSTAIPNLSLISSARCSLEVANLFHAQKIRIIRAIRSLPYECILLDLGSGTHFNTLDFFLSANEGIFVTTAEPTAIENTFRFIKSIYLRKFRQILTESGMWHICRRELGNLSKGGIRYPSELIEILLRKDSEKVGELRDQLHRLRFGLAVNKLRQQTSSNFGQQLVNVCNRHFYVNFTFLGNVSYDNRVHDAIIAYNIFLHKYPYTTTAVDLQNITKRLLKEDERSAELLASRS